jgi:hypothetical protein
MTTTCDLEQCLADFEHRAAGDFQIESAHTKVSPRLGKLDGMAQEALDHGQVLMLKQRHRPLARTAVVGV